MATVQRVVITPGEPAGIGPDLVVQLAQREWPVELVVCADARLLTDRPRCSVCPSRFFPTRQITLQNRNPPAR